MSNLVLYNIPKFHSSLLSKRIVNSNMLLPNSWESKVPIILTFKRG